MSDIYKQHDAAFASVSAYVVLKDGERVATIAFKHSPTSGRVTVYAHWIGIEMVRGHADGGGYDKKSAAVESACRKLPELSAQLCADATPLHSLAERTLYGAFIEAITLGPDGLGWDRNLHDAGFTVLQAV